MKKYLLGLCVTILAISLLVAAPKTTIISFIGDAHELLDANKYVTGPPHECHSGTDLPCQVELPDGVTTGAEFMTWLETNFPSNPTAQVNYIFSHAISMREAE